MPLGRRAAAWTCVALAVGASGDSATCGSKALTEDDKDVCSAFYESSTGVAYSLLPVDAWEKGPGQPGRVVDGAFFVPPGETQGHTRVLQLECLAIECVRKSIRRSRT